MSIQDITDKFKHFFEDSELFTAFLLVLVALLAFQLGRMSVENETATVSNEAAVTEADFSNNEEVTELVMPKDAETVVVSKNGTKYHLPWCSGALNIKEENKITFNTIAEAKAAGYTPAGNCKGI